MTSQPRWRSALGTALLALPDTILERLFSGVIGYGRSDVPPPVQAKLPAADVRLLIAPANYAGQAHAWAHSVMRRSGVSAQNLTVAPADAPRFRADDFVPTEIFQKSHRWGRRQASAVAERFTHVLVEAERPILGRHLAGDIRAEHAFLRAAGIGTAYVSHGSDVRRPSLHADSDRWSPFRDADWDMLPVLERVTRQNNAFLDEVGEPVFVVTPELLRDRPGATWLPNIVDASSWAVDEPLFETGHVRLLHAPTNARIKGTHLIEPVIESLDPRVFEYRRVTNTAPHAMRDVYANTDVVLEQFRLGIYSTTAIEAMAAGRVVVAHVADDIRASVRRMTGLDLPIVQATPDTLADILHDISVRQEHYAELASRGPGFVHAIHSGPSAVSALLRFLGGGRID